MHMSITAWTQQSFTFKHQQKTNGWKNCRFFSSRWHHRFYFATVSSRTKLAPRSAKAANVNDHVTILSCLPRCPEVRSPCRLLIAALDLLLAPSAVKWKLPTKLRCSPFLSIVLWLNTKRNFNQYNPNYSLFNSLFGMLTSVYRLLFNGL